MEKLIRVSSSASGRNTPRDSAFDADLIALIAPMRAVRNQIIHDGGQANPFKSQVELGLDSDFDDMLDLSFSKQYPKFVQGESSSAEVTASEEQLEEVITGSVELVKWSAQGVAYAGADTSSKRR